MKMLTCKDVTELASRRLDGPLPWFTRVRMRFHLVICKYCARYTRQVEQIHRLAPEYSETVGQSGARGLSTEARDRIKTSLRNQGP